MPIPNASSERGFSTLLANRRVPPSSAEGLVRSNPRSRFFAAYYLVSVLAAAICHLVVITWMGAEPAPTVGASGGVYGLLLAYGLYFPNRQLMLLIPPIPMRARTFVIVFALLELVLGVTGTAAGVAHFAHLSGMLGGYLMIQYRRGFRR